MNQDKPAKNEGGSKPITWKGEQAFYIAGTEHDDDTIRIVADGHELILKLVMPTLCITYADMKFANSVGGVQKDYPDSATYGPKYFDPPVVLNGEKEVEEFTWIRGAKRVTIGPKVTVIEWPSWHTLIIPKLRIKAKEKVKALLKIPKVEITVSSPYASKILQYADGRHVGGIHVTKRHPDWKPEPVPQKYDLWVRAIDGHTRRAIPEAKVSLFTWEAKRFVLEAHWYANEMGIIEASGLPSSDRKLVTVECRPWLLQAWRFRPLPGQKVRRTFRLWQSKEGSCSYEWRERDSLESIAKLTGTQPATILKINRLRSADELKPGQTIKVPCIEAIYPVEARDTLEILTERFCYNSVDELALANELPKPYRLNLDQELRLPGWRFFQSGSDDYFVNLDEQFGLPRGWSRPAQRTLHDDPTRAYEHEVIAIPTQEFVSAHNLRKWH